MQNETLSLLKSRNSGWTIIDLSRDAKQKRKKDGKKKTKKRKGRATAAAKPPSPETRRWMEVVASELFSARVAVSPRPAESDPESAPQSVVSEFPGTVPDLDFQIDGA